VAKSKDKKVTKKAAKKGSKNTPSAADIVATLEEKHGKACARRLGDTNTDKIDVISTGSIHLDEALGIGGVPRGRVIEIYGPEGSGKTTLALHIIACAQAAGGLALFVDAEHALDPDLAKKMHVNIEDLILAQPDSGEQGLDILETGIRTGSLAVAVVDSVSALTPQAEIDGEMGDQQMGLQARLMGKALRKINGITFKTNTLVIFINQIRQKIGVVFGNPETTSGGNALKFYASVRIDIRAIGKIKGKSSKSDKKKGKAERIVGNKVRVKVVKNKLAPPFKSIETDLIFGYGFNREGEILDLGYDLDVIERRGAFYYYNDQKFAQGRSDACKVLRKNPKLVKAILTNIKIAQA